MAKLTPRSLENYENLIVDFHGSLAPGLLIGCAMIELATVHLPPGELFDVICETDKCLPDAVQLLTPCTTGNGWLKVLAAGRFALTFYEKRTGEAVRVYLDRRKLDEWPEIRSWFLKSKPKCEQDKERLLADIRRAGTSVLSIQRGRVDTGTFARRKGDGIVVCPTCDEAYPAAHGRTCRICSGELAYFGQ